MFLNLPAQISHHRAAETDSPTPVLVREEESFQLVLRATSFHRPILPSIDGVNDRSFGTNGPSFERIDKLHIKEIDINCRFLTFPGAASVDGVKDASAA